jgi:hypothetical protein
MSVESHEWQRDKDKKTYLKMLENNDDDIKDAYYDPKQFRGSSKAKSRSKISVFVVLSFLFGLLLIGFTVDYFLEGKIKKSIENFLKTMYLQ